MAGYIQQNRINTLVLAKLFQLAQTENQSVYDEFLINFFSKRVGGLRVRMALNSALEDGFVDHTHDDGEDWYSISSTGYAHIEEMYLKNTSSLRHLVDSDFADFLSEDNQSAIEGDGDREDLQVPASDRFVSISDNLPGYREVVATVETASNLVRGSNLMAAEERSWIRIHIENGLGLLRTGGKVLRSALQSLIVEPLKAALKDSSEDGMKEAIRAALNAIKIYLGI